MNQQSNRKKVQNIMREIMSAVYNHEKKTSRAGIMSSDPVKIDYSLTYDLLVRVFMFTILYAPRSCHSTLVFLRCGILLP